MVHKRIFMVQFDSQKGFNSIITDGPVFWGRAGLIVTPWFTSFNANSIIVSKFSVWVRPHNLPLPFWHHWALEGIGNSWGIFIKMDSEIIEK